jgi:hypothetical protein
MWLNGSERLFEAILMISEIRAIGGVFVLNFDHGRVKRAGETPAPRQVLLFSAHRLS